MANSVIVEVKNLTKRFDELLVLENVSIEVLRAENLIVFGKSGSGKSVLLKCIIGLMKPDAGNIFINSQNVLELSIEQVLIA